MKQILFMALLMTFFLGCNTKVSEPEIDREKSVVPTHIAVFEVEGMMCQKGCGATIRKGLYDTGGVSKVEVIFEEERPVNEIKVFFDIKKTSTEKMIAVIGGLEEMRYTAKLKKVTETRIVNLEEEKIGNSSHKLKGVTSAESSNSKIYFPNLTKLLNSLIN